MVPMGPISPKKVASLGLHITFVTKFIYKRTQSSEQKQVDQSVVESPWESQEM
jgi:hypothetical protein